jgi:Tol biopolymer transport system component
MRRYTGIAAAIGSVTLTLTLVLTASSLSTPPAVQRVSVTSADGQALGSSQSASLSADGRYVAFSSDAAGLVPNDTNGYRDVFVHDRVTGITDRVSVSSGGGEAHGTSAGVLLGPPRISADGRFVAFASEAPDLVPNDGNRAPDVFVRDRVAGTTERASLGHDDAPLPGESVAPSISGDGRYVTFTALSDGVVPGDDNTDRDVFVRDRVAGTTELISVALDGTSSDRASGGFGAGPARITPDGRYVVFGSFSTDLVDGDANNFDDVFVRDRVAGTTERVSVATDGTEGNGHSVYGTISDDGRYVAFNSAASTLSANDMNILGDVFLRDRQAGTTVRLSDAPSEQANGASSFVAISGDGSSVAYHSEASNLVAGDANTTADVFLQDIASGAIERVSVPAIGEAHGASTFAGISADGSVVAFESVAADLVPGDGNGARDVFVWGKALRVPPPPATATRTPTPPRCLPLLGDANGDGTANSLDALLILQYIADLVPSLPNLAKADTNQDGSVTAVDAFLLLQYQAGLIACLPP